MVVIKDEYGLERVPAFRGSNLTFLKWFSEIADEYCDFGHTWRWNGSDQMKPLVEYGKCRLWEEEYFNNFLGKDALGCDLDNHSFYDIRVFCETPEERFEPSRIVWARKTWEGGLIDLTNGSEIVVQLRKRCECTQDVIDLLDAVGRGLHEGGEAVRRRLNLTEEKMFGKEEL